MKPRQPTADITSALRFVQRTLERECPRYDSQNASLIRHYTVIRDVLLQVIQDKENHSEVRCVHGVRYDNRAACAICENSP